VWLWTNTASNPVDVANTICNTILARGLGEGEVAITIMNFGRGTMVGHPLDALPTTTADQLITRATPWTTNGVAQVTAWTDAFIAQYQLRQTQNGVPSPARFHMDSELRLPAICYLPNIANCWGTSPLQVFHEMRSDPRWTTELLRMNPNRVPTLRTMSELYAAAGSPSYDQTQPRDAAVNRAWSVWWDGIMRESVDGAFDAAFYSRVKGAWPSVRTSEFAQTMRIDDGVEPDGTRRRYIDFEWWNEGWMSSSWCGRGDLQAPALYLFGETFVDPFAPFMDEQIRLHRANLDASLHSFGGVDPSEVTPWVVLPGIGLPFGEAPATDRAYTPDEWLRLAALLRSRGIEEFVAWPSVSSSLWTSFTDAIDAAWAPSLVSVLGIGTPLPPNAVELLRSADRQPCLVTPAKSGFELRASFVVPAVSPCSSGADAWIAIEGSSAATAVWSVELARNNGTWQTIGSPTVLADAPNASWFGPVDTSAFFDAGAATPTLTVRVRSTSGAAAAIDLIQVVQRPQSNADIDRDGMVGSADLSMLLGAWSTQDAALDQDGDGFVNSADLSILLGKWGVACE